MFMSFCAERKQLILIDILGYSPSRAFPILVYFKETQTPEENWNVGPGEQANSEEAIAKGAGKIIFCILFTSNKNSSMG